MGNAAAEARNLKVNVLINLLKPHELKYLSILS